jgi:hypothetical protein
MSPAEVLQVGGNCFVLEAGQKLRLWSDGRLDEGTTVVGESNGFSIITTDLEGKKAIYPFTSASIELPTGTIIRPLY